MRNVLEELIKDVPDSCGGGIKFLFVKFTEVEMIQSTVPNFIFKSQIQKKIRNVLEEPVKDVSDSEKHKFCGYTSWWLVYI